MTLSKSQYIRGLQCHKSLWLYKNKPELRDSQSQAQESLQMEADNQDSISASELKNLMEILNFSSITAVDDGKGAVKISYEDRKQNKDTLRTIADELNRFYKDKFKTLNDKFTEPRFLVYQPRWNNSATIYCVIINNGVFQLGFLFDNMYYSIHEYDGGSKNNSKAGMDFMNSNFADFEFTEVTIENKVMHVEIFESSMSFEQKLEKFTIKIKSVIARLFEVLEADKPILPPS